MTTQSLKLVNTKDGEQIAIWKIMASTNDRCAVQAQNILLTHGTFSDKKVCLGIASYLAKLGHTCYIMEWRGHGDSPTPKKNFNFETIATYDIAATFRYLFTDLKIDNLHCVTHSGGGICLTMFLIQNEHYIHKINSISLFACQAYGAVLNPKSYAQIVLFKSFTRLLGYIPAKRFKLGSVNESYHTMLQWFDWNLNKSFESDFIDKDISKDLDERASNQNNKQKSSEQNPARLDYRVQMPKITTPIYAISAKGDKFIAPTAGCKLFLKDFNHKANIFREFAIEHDDLEDYNHSRIIISRSAAKEVWPTVAAWIHKYAK